MFRSIHFGYFFPRGRKPLGLLLSIVALLLSMILSMDIGPVSVPIQYIIASLLKQMGFHHVYVPSAYYIIVTQLREPEIVGAMAVGASLSIGGATIQSVFRNPITDPYVTGISSGAALGAVIAIVGGLSFLGYFTISFMAFIFSVLIVLTVYLISMRNGRAPPTFLLLSGIAVSLFVSSMVALLLYSNPRYVTEVFIWLLGSIQGIQWGEDYVIVPVVMLCSFVLFTMSNELNALQMGENHARAVGVNVEVSKAIIIIITTLSVSAAVSISGIIGFVGLIFPHVSRLIYGGSNKYVIPSSGILGATFLVICNDIAHVLVFGEVIPIGIITGIIGVPFFIGLMMKLSRSGYYDT